LKENDLVDMNPKVMAELLFNIKIVKTSGEKSDQKFQAEVSDIQEKSMKMMIDF
tara:strand:- start:536 stop:697 length:162 start_codon:yes stop_codon:yes gene_type:complete